VDGDEAPQVDLRGARGAQAGNGNVQQNYYGPVTQVRDLADTGGLPSARPAYLEQVRRIGACQTG
jgi:hypothetical protein